MSIFARPTSKEILTQQDFGTEEQCTAGRKNCTLHFNVIFISKSLMLLSHTMLLSNWYLLGALSGRVEPF